MDAHANFAYSTVATAPSPAASGTTLVVAAGQGALFPTVPFNATVWPAATIPVSTNAEIVRVTAISTDTLTITRAQESSVARTIVVSDQIAATVTKKTFTDLETDLASTATQTALQAAQIAAQAAAGLAYYVNSGLTLTPNATPTKLDMAAGVAFVGTTELNVAAQTAISTTIASMADATNPKWVAVELDTSAVVNFNQGTAAASPAFPTPTASRVVLGWLWIPANATNVDALLTTSNGLAKLIDARVVRSVHAARQVGRDLVGAGAGAGLTNPTSLTSLLAATISVPANSLSVGDILRFRASGTYKNTQNNSTIQIMAEIGSSQFFNYTTVSLVLDGGNSRKWAMDVELAVTAIGATGNAFADGIFEITAAGAAGTLAISGGDQAAAARALSATFDSTGALAVDIQGKITTSSSTAIFLLQKCTLTKIPA